MEFMGFINLTPFAIQPLLMADERGADILVLVAKARYLIVGTDSLALDDEQLPPEAAGSYYGKPGESSLRVAPELDFVKPATDIALIGQAHAPGARPVGQLDVRLTVGPVSKTVRVFGDRHWLGSERKEISAPRPFLSMPLVYERAFGGDDLTAEDSRKHERDQRNPVGTGLNSPQTCRQGPLPLPNLEDPAQLIVKAADRPAPAGFGFISPDWEWRLRHAGTYDESWERMRMPLLPEDFDRGFFNAAHPDLIARGYLQGGEAVEVVNASPRGKLAFSLPGAAPEGVVMLKDDSRHVVSMKLDTVVIDSDEHRLTLLWRGHLAIHRRIHDLLWVKTQMAGARPGEDALAA